LVFPCRGSQRAVRSARKWAAGRVNAGVQPRCQTGFRCGQPGYCWLGADVNPSSGSGSGKGAGLSLGSWGIGLGSGCGWGTGCGSGTGAFGRGGSGSTLGGSTGGLGIGSTFGGTGGTITGFAGISCARADEVDKLIAIVSKMILFIPPSPPQRAPGARCAHAWTYVGRQ